MSDPPKKLTKFSLSVFSKTHEVHKGKFGAIAWILNQETVTGRFWFVGWQVPEDLDILNPCLIPNLDGRQRWQERPKRGDRKKGQEILSS